MARRKNDFYETPSFMIEALLHIVPEIKGRVLEICSGDNSITRVLMESKRFTDVLTNDIDPVRTAYYHQDAATTITARHFDWVITNPPYTMPLCIDIVANAVKHARVGVAMMLRLSFEEPTQLRGPWLEDNPITKRIVMPRHSFTGNGKSDSVTTAWMIWSKIPLSGPPNISLYNAEALYGGE